MAIIDLTTVVGSDSPLIQWAKSQDNVHVAMGHVGTHLDTYEKSIIPVEFFRSQGVLFNVSDIAENKEIDISDINLDQISEQSFVIFRTGRIERSSYGDKEYFNNHPQLSHNLIEALLQKNIRFIGIDCAGIRQHQEHEEADRKCEKHGVYVIENLCNLDKIQSDSFTVFTMWLDDPIMTGLKCRVLVEE